MFLNKGWFRCGLASSWPKECHGPKCCLLGQSSVPWHLAAQIRIDNAGASSTFCCCCSSKLPRFEDSCAASSKIWAPRRASRAFLGSISRGAKFPQKKLGKWHSDPWVSYSTGHVCVSNLPLGNSSWSWCTSTGTSPLRRRSSCCGRACQLIHIGHSPVTQTSSFQVLKMVSVESLWFSFNYVTCTNHNKKVIILTFSSTIRVHSLSPPTPEVSTSCFISSSARPVTRCCRRYRRSTFQLGQVASVGIFQHD